MSAKNNTPTVRRMLKTVFLTAALGFGIKALLLHPLFIQLASNVAYQNTWYTNILYYLIDGGLIDLAVFAVCYPATAYAVWKDGLKASRPVVTAFPVTAPARSFWPAIPVWACFWPCIGSLLSYFACKTAPSIFLTAWA